MAYVTIQGLNLHFTYDHTITMFSSGYLLVKTISLNPGLPLPRSVIKKLSRANSLLHYYCMTLKDWMSLKIFSLSGFRSPMVFRVILIIHDMPQTAHLPLPKSDEGSSKQFYWSWRAKLGFPSSLETSFKEYRLPKQGSPWARKKNRTGNLTRSVFLPPSS